MKRIQFFFFLLFIGVHAQALNYYWVGGNGNWTDYSHHWAVNSGDTIFHTKVPGPSDNVIFDENSFSAPEQYVNVDTLVANCKNFIWSGINHIPTFQTGNQFTSLNVFGIFRLSLDMNFNYYGNLNFHSGTSTLSITTRNKLLDCNVKFLGKNNFTWIMQDSFKCSSCIFMEGGIINLNKKYLSAACLSIGDSTSTTLLANESTIYISSDQTAWKAGLLANINGENSQIDLKGDFYDFGGNEYNSIELSCHRDSMHDYIFEGGKNGNGTYIRKISVKNNTDSLYSISFSGSIVVDSIASEINVKLSQDLTLQSQYIHCNRNLFVKSHSFSIQRIHTDSTVFFVNSGSNSSGVYIDSMVGNKLYMDTTYTLSNTHINFLSLYDSMFIGKQKEVNDFTVYELLAIGYSKIESFISIKKAIFRNSAFLGNNISIDTLLLSINQEYIIDSQAILYIHDSIFAEGNCKDRIVLKSAVPNVPAYIFKDTSLVHVQGLVVQNISIIGGAIFNAASSIEIGDNSGWVFNQGESAEIYWIGGNGKWSDPDHWITKNGDRTCLPGPYDTVIFDKNSFDTTGQLVILDKATTSIGSMIWRDQFFKPTLRLDSSIIKDTLKPNIALILNGSLFLDTNMIFDYHENLFFTSTDTTEIIVPMDSIMQNNFFFQGVVGQWQILDTLTTRGSIWISNGTVIAKNLFVEANELHLKGPGAALIIDSSTINLLSLTDTSFFNSEGSYISTKNSWIQCRADIITNGNTFDTFIGNQMIEDSASMKVFFNGSTIRNLILNSEKDSLPSIPIFATGTMNNLHAKAAFSLYTLQENIKLTVDSLIAYQDATLGEGSLDINTLSCMNNLTIQHTDTLNIKKVTVAKNLHLVKDKPNSHIYIDTMCVNGLAIFQDNQNTSALHINLAMFKDSAHLGIPSFIHACQLNESSFIAHANVFDTLSLFPGNKYILQSSGTVSINHKLIAEGKPNENIYIQSSTDTRAVLHSENYSVCYEYLSLKGIEASGTNTNFMAGFGSIDEGNNTGWSIQSDVNCKYLYQSLDLLSNFVPSTTYGIAPLFVRFENFSKGNASNYYWNFGDGNYSDSKNSAHTYEKDGTYLACLTIYNSSSQGQSQYCTEIIVGDGCSADFSFFENQNGELSFVNLSSNADTYYWTFGDGNSSMNPNPHHSWNSGGIHKVKLVSYNSETGCMASKEMDVYTKEVWKDCNANFYYITGINSSEVVFFNRSSGHKAKRLLWDLGDGKKVANLDAFNYSYDLYGHYNVCLTAEFEFAQQTSCKTIYVGKGKSEHCLSNFIAFPDRSKEKIVVKNLSLTDQESFLWQINNSNLEKTFEPQFMLTDSTKIAQPKLLLYNKNDQCWDTYNTCITLDENETLIPRFSYIVNQSHYDGRDGSVQVTFHGVSNGHGSNIKWDFGDGKTNETNDSPIHTFEVPGNYLVCYTVEDKLLEISNTWCDTVKAQIISSTSQQNNFTQLGINPNPCSNQLHIKINEALFSPSQLTLYDLQGKLIERLYIDSSLKSITIDVSHLISGIYQIELISKNGMRRFSKIAKI